MLDFNSQSDISSLPVIAEDLKMRRPISEYKPSHFISIDKDLD